MTLLFLFALSCRGPTDDAVATTDKTKPPKKPKVEKQGEAPKEHRATATRCSSDDVPTTPTKMSAGTPCKTRADCKASARCVSGYCRNDSCHEDSDCKGKAVCACDPMGRGHRCLESDCRVDADCGPGGFCSPSFGLACGSYHGVLSYHCHTKDDDCVNDEDCRKKGATYGYCAFEPKSGHWVCGTSECDG